MEYEKDFSNQMMTNDSEMNIPDKNSIKSKATVKIKVPKGTGTGFFIKLERNKKPFYCLMTNQHVIESEMILNKEIIFLYDNEERLISEIKLNIKERIIICFMELLKLDVTLVEIIPKDNINYQTYFLLPYNFNNDFNPHQFMIKDIEIMQYPQGGEQCFSYGKTCGLYPDNYNIFIHNCNTNFGSSGGPIFLSGDQRVIAIHKGVYNAIKENAGLFIEPIIKYLQNYKRNGEGIEYYENGQTKFVGEFLNDEYNGEGTFYYPNGDYYIGQFKNGIKNGKGYEYYSNGEVFSGLFKNGLKNGYGCIMKNNIKIKEGLFMNDQFINNGEINQSSFQNNNNTINNNVLNNNNLYNDFDNNNNNMNINMNNLYSNNMNNFNYNTNFMNNSIYNLMNNFFHNNIINNNSYGNINNNILYNNNNNLNNNSNLYSNNNLYNNNYTYNYNNINDNINDYTNDYNNNNDNNNNSYTDYTYNYNDEIDNKNNKVKNDEDSFTGKACKALHSLGCFFNGRCKVCKHYVEDHEVFQNSIWMCKECPEESNLCKSL